MARLLVSYSGHRRADVDFTKARAVQFKAWQKAANEAVKAKQEKPPKPDNLRGDTLYLNPGSTTFVTLEELAVIKADRKDVAKYLQVHKKAPKVPRSLRSKDKEGSGSGDNKSITTKKTKRATKPR